jgi:hypothetical protein
MSYARILAAQALGRSGKSQPMLRHVWEYREDRSAIF